jgi:MGT family glycosyltransferase
MSKVLFLGVPSHGHVNPTLGLVSELVRQGEKITYFASEEFRGKIEEAGAACKSYVVDLNIFKIENEDHTDPMVTVIRSADVIIEDILQQIEGMQFDYIIHSAAFPFTKAMAQILQLPTVSSLAVFAGIKDFMDDANTEGPAAFPGMDEMMTAYRQVSQTIFEKYGVHMPDNIMELLLNKADLNLIYTSEYFIPPADRVYYDDTYKFVGPPVAARKEDLDFPFEKLEGRKVIYISLGTVFGNYMPRLYDIFIESLKDMDAVIVMAAFNVDLSLTNIPGNFIVRNYVPQSALLPYTTAAITHAGMNSISDLVYADIPFVSIPLGADQPLLAQRAEELGATIVLDAVTLTPEILRGAVEKVMSEPAYLQHLKKISDSFKQAGGYPRAVQEIFQLKKKLDI